MSMPDLLTGPRLGDFHGRDNNLNLIRFLAASAVIWTHAFGFLRYNSLEPVKHTFGIGAGDVAVDVFFVLSGFLVSKSLEGKSPLQYLWARGARIYPALWISLVLTVAVVAFCFTPEPAVRFLRAHATTAYLLSNSTMLPGLGARLTLRHAFAHAGDTFNVPLWTLPFELQMYGLLAVIGFTVGLRPHYAAAIALLAMISIAMSKFGGEHWMTIDRARFLCLFFVGSLAYTLRRHIVLRGWIAATLLVAIVIAVMLTHQYAIRQAALLFALPYLILWSAWVPGGVLRRWNRLGDYSYGMYIYGCPVQAALVATGVTRTVGGNFVIAMLVTLPIAMASWHLVEQRALKTRLPAVLQSRPRALTSSQGEGP